MSHFILVDQIKVASIKKDTKTYYLLIYIRIFSKI